MNSFVSRNLKVFFRDKSSVFFSIFAILIIIFMYILFLGDAWGSSFENVANVKQLMNEWIMAGLIAVTSVTTTMGAFGIMVEDKYKNIVKDFYSAPIKRRTIVSSYILSSFIIGLIMSFLGLLIIEIYLFCSGSQLLSLLSLLKVSGLIVVTTFCNTAIILFMVSFFSSLNAFSTASTIIGTLIGFLAGIYMPIGILPATIQSVVKLVPISHSAVLFRQVMMKYSLADSFKGAPDAALNEFKQILGVQIKFNGIEVPAYISILYLILTGIVFYILAIWNTSRKK